MADSLNLSLPQRKIQKEKIPKWISVFLFGLLIVGVANLYVSLVDARIEKKPSSHEQLSLEALKGLALKLEKQGLENGAASTWKEYLAAAEVEKEEGAKIWYRIGKLYQQAENHESALEAYYRSESFAGIPDLEMEINRRTQESLESLGKFSALRYELEERVGVDKSKDNSGDMMLAEIGNQKITRAEVDQRIEKAVEAELYSMGAFLPEDQRKKEKEALLRRFSSGAEMMRLLNQLVLEEILYRKARKDKLTEEPTVRMMVRNAERSILARQVLQNELANEIKITAGDIQTYYEAKKEKYVEPEQARISHILVEGREDADKIIGELKEGASFEDLAKKHSLDEKTRDGGGSMDSWITRDVKYIPGIGGAEKDIGAIFGTEAGEVVDEVVHSDEGYHVIKVRERKPERQKDIEGVRSEVYQALRSQKEREVQEALVAKLREEYNVVIHASRFMKNSVGGE